MVAIRWKTPVPVIRLAEDPSTALLRLGRWLQEQEGGTGTSIGSALVFGGSDVAERIFGFEGVHSSYTAPDEKVILAPPLAPRKFVVVGLHVQIDAAVGVFEVIKRKASTDVILVSVNAPTLNHEEVVGNHKAGYITLDAADESLVIKTVSGTADISYSGSYLDVD